MTRKQLSAADEFSSYDAFVGEALAGVLDEPGFTEADSHFLILNWLLQFANCGAMQERTCEDLKPYVDALSAAIDALSVNRVARNWHLVERNGLVEGERFAS